MWKDIGDPTRCDYRVPLVNEPTDVLDDDLHDDVPDAPVELPDFTDPPDDVVADAIAPEDPPVITTPASVGVAAAVITAPASVGVVDLARRSPMGGIGAARKVRSEYTINHRPVSCHARDARNACKLQDAWDHYRDCVGKLFCPSFWQFFLPIHHLPSNAIDAALRAAKSTFLFRGTDTFKNFPPSKRAMITKMNTVRVQFWPLVIHQVDIDLSRFQLPSGTMSIKFRFIDPVWGWLVAARRLNPQDLHWKPVEQHDANPVYGGGVQFGKAFGHACATCRQRGGYPMLFSLHWDGTGAHGLNAAPICIGVANYNGSSASAHYCVGYVPATPDDKSITDSTLLKHYIRQKCAECILGVMESSAQTGILCRLRNQHGEEVERLLFPRLMSMNFDQPEAQLCFGLQNKTSCSKCRWRKGYSAFRKATAQSGAAVRRLYQHAGNKDKKAQAQLLRWGFNYQRVSCLFSLRDILIDLPGKDEVYPCLDYRDVMHGLKIFLHRVIVLKTINAIKSLSKAHKRTLLSRMETLFKTHTFRNHEGDAYRRKVQIFSPDHMSAKDKVALLFILPHVFGHRGEILSPQVREPLLTALAHAQLLVIATSGLRSYNEHELDVIFNRGYVQLFGALQSLQCLEYNGQLARHQEDPDKNAAPSEPNLQQKDDNCDTDTDSTDEESFAGRGIFSHGSTALSHQHWVDQVISAGCFSIHNTEAAEAYHKHCMRLASSRVRHLNQETTTHSMLKYMYLHDLFSEMQEAAARKKKTKVKFSYGVRVPLVSHGATVEMKVILNVIPRKRFTAALLTSTSLQKLFFHRELLLTRYELLDLVCDFFSLSRKRESYAQLECLNWQFGQKLIRKDGKVFWATDSQYPYAYKGDAGTGRRRDMLFLKGTELDKTTNALCCETVAFCTLAGLSRIPFQLPSLVSEAIDEDTDELTFVIVRWFVPHPQSTTRDDLHRPICPGPLHINHCLWRYSRTPVKRQSLCKPNGTPSEIYKEQKHMFGATEAERTQRWTLDQRAYFDIITPDRILNTVNMCPTFIEDTTSVDYGTWLQTVTMI